MDRLVLLLLAAIVAGFSLLNIDLTGPVLGAIGPIISLIAVIAILVSSLYLIFLAAKAILRR